MIAAGRFSRLPRRRLNHHPNFLQHAGGQKDMSSSSRFVIIGGIPTAGKSSLARRIAKNRSMDYVSTDMITRIIFTVATKKQAPWVHFFRKQDPNAYFLKITPARFVQEFKKEAREVRKGVMGFLTQNKALAESGAVVEGAALLPDIAAELKKKFQARTLFLTAHSKEEVSANIHKRGLWTTAARAQEKEIACLWALNEYIKIRARKLHLPVIRSRPLASLAARARKFV